MKRHVNHDFFKQWSHDMSYILGYIVADGCIIVSKDRKENPFSLNITSTDRAHLLHVRNTLNSNHKIGKKGNGHGTSIAFQFTIRSRRLADDLIHLGVTPQKTHTIKPIRVPKKYFHDFARGFFDGDGSVYIYTVNNTPQIKAHFLSASLPFFKEFNKQICRQINLPSKAIHSQTDRKRNKKTQYSTCFYIDDCKKLFRFLYKKSRLFLSRKYQVFKKWEKVSRRMYFKQIYPSKIGWNLYQKGFKAT